MTEYWLTESAALFVAGDSSPWRRLTGPGDAQHTPHGGSKGGFDGPLRGGSPPPCNVMAGLVRPYGLVARIMCGGRTD